MQEKLNSPLDNVAKIFCQKMTQQSQKGQAERSSPSRKTHTCGISCFLLFKKKKKLIQQLYTAECEWRRSQLVARGTSTVHSAHRGRSAWHFLKTLVCPLLQCLPTSQFSVNKTTQSHHHLVPWDQQAQDSGTRGTDSHKD